MTYPLFVSVEFEDTDAPKTPLTPVRSVSLGYNGASGLCRARFNFGSDDADGTDGTDDMKKWADVADYISEFTRQLPNYAIVGWDLRNLEWPALLLNIARWKAPFEKKLMLPPAQKWNNLPLVDLRNLVLQGGFSEEKFTLNDTFRAMFPDEGLASAITMTKMLYDRYVSAL